jgi:hypothetical protein
MTIIEYVADQLLEAQESLSRHKRSSAMQFAPRFTLSANSRDLESPKIMAFLSIPARTSRLSAQFSDWLSLEETEKF